jgi:Collagen triple helix repeat (20 copies)
MHAPSRRLGAPVLALVALMAVASGLFAASAAHGATTIRLYACVTKAYKTLNLTTRAAPCRAGERKVSWSVEGPRGPAGKKGAQGTSGTKGAKGDVGAIGNAGAGGATGAAGATGATGAPGAAGSPDSAGDVLAKLLTVDGAGSGLDADRLAGAALTDLQSRVTGVCAPGRFLQSIAADGTVGCAIPPAPAVPLTLAQAGTGDSSTVLTLDHAGLGKGLQVNLPNGSGGGAGVDVNVDGVGTGILADTAFGIAVRGVAHAVSAAGVVGDNARGEVVVGRGGSGCTDALGSNCAGIGVVVGRNDGPGGFGVRGFSTAAGSTYKGIGVLGQAGISGGNGAAVRGENVNAANASNAVEAVTNGAGSALLAQGAQAATFNGAVTINGDLTVTGTKSGFHIDDPRAPAARTLTHTPVETDELTVQYSGNVRTDARGRAVVRLPAYAATIAGGWRYQLTPIGSFGQVIVAREVHDDRFVVRSEHPRTKVSWSIIGTRTDPQARATPIAPVQAKRGADRGRYLAPELYGKPASAGVDRVRPVGSAGIAARAASARGKQRLVSSR